MSEKIPAVNLKNMLSFSLPMMVSQATETIMLFTDRFFLSRLGKTHISAAMSGGLSAFVFASFFFGIVGYVNALVAQYYGAGQLKNTYKATSQALWLSILFYLPTLLFIPLVYLFFKWTGHSPLQLDLEYTYFRILMFGSIFSMIRNSLGGFFLGKGKTRVVMIANILGMLINVPLNFWFIFGGLGLKPLGIQGAAYGTLGGSLTSVLFLLILYVISIKKEENKTLTTGIWKLDSPIMKKLLKFGIPAGGEFFINLFLFNFFLQLMYSYGEDVAAAITIAFNYDMLAFIPMIGIGIAVTAMVGQQMGAGLVEGARKVNRLALKVGYIYGTIMVILFLVFAEPLVRVFSGGFGEGDTAVIPLAKTMLRLACIYILADATQLILAGTLRGAGDTKWVMYLSVILHGVMACGALILIKVLKVAPLTAWLFFIGFALSLGVAMLFRFLTGHWQKIRMISPEAD